MSRFLFVVPPLTGHTNPTISLGRALERRGHEVAWAAHSEPARSLLPPDARLLSVFEELPESLVDDLIKKAQGLRGVGALKFLWEDFILPLAREMRDGVETAVDAFAPDVLVVDQQAVAGALVAQRRGIPWATSATTSAEFTDPLGRFPKVKAWIDGNLRALQLESGVPVEIAERVDPRFSDHLVVVFSTPALIGWSENFPKHFAFVGPSIDARPEVSDFPWDALADTRRILVSLGTINAEMGQRFFGAVIEALGGRDLQVFIVAPPDEIGPTPDNVIVRARVPQLALLPHLNGVVCHGGHNTVCETLAHGLPLVVAPIRDDQPVIAQQVAESGAGIRVRFGRVRAAEIGSAVDEILDNPSYRDEALRIQASFRAAGGAERAARELEAIA